MNTQDNRQPQTHRVVVVIPIYKTTLDEMEYFSIDYSVRTLRGQSIRDFVFIHPEGLALSYYTERFPGASFLSFPPLFFASHRNYNQLCYEVEFYKQFSYATHMLILQPDALVVGSTLGEWCDSRYDFVGAPECNTYSYDIRGVPPFNKLDFLEPIRLSGCNGGLSLRRISAVTEALQQFKELAKFFRGYGVGVGEDIFFSVVGRISGSFQVTCEFAASKFAITDKFRQWMAFNEGVMPFGFHAWYNNPEDKAFVLELVAAMMTERGNGA